MPILNSSLAVARGAGVKNTNMGGSGQDVARNIVIIGTYLSTISGITNETVYGPYSNAAQIGVVFGLGSMIHRLALGIAAAGSGVFPVTVWVIPQAEAGGAAAATSSTFAITGPATAAGTLSVYVAVLGSYGVYKVTVNNGDANTTIATNLAAAINADPNTPVVATVTGTPAATVTLTAKSKGPWGNSIPVAVNVRAGDALPAGVGVTVTALSGGSGVPVIANALNALGTGSNANTLPGGQWMTELVHGYLGSGSLMATTAQDQTTITAISTYNGLANQSPPTGCYDHIVGKPFRCLNGDVTNSTSVPSALLTFATTNEYDRTDGIICVGGSRTHPCEMAAVASGVIEGATAANASTPYDGLVLPGVDPGPSGQWQTDYTNRDTAVKGGITPTLIQGGAVLLQNVVTFYAVNPGIPTVSNGYREFANIAKLQNIIADLLSRFRSVKWTGCTVVADSASVVDPVARQKVRSADDVTDELIAAVKFWLGKAWIYSADAPLAALQAGTVVTVRAAGDGFTNVLPVILSGMANIIDTTVDFDINVAA